MTPRPTGCFHGRPTGRQRGQHSLQSLARSLVGAAALSLLFPATASTQDTNSEPCAAIEGDEITACASADEQPPRQFDWAPIGEVPEEDQDRSCVNCGGRYLDPLAAQNTDTPPEESEFRARAERSELREGEVTLSGGTVASQGYRRMRGDEVVVDRIEETVIISGNVTLREPGVMLAGDRADVNSQTGEASITNGEFVFHREHMHGTADLLERDTEGKIFLHDSKVSFCAPEDDDWAVYADQLDIDLEEGLGTAHDAHIELGGVPVFYTPWLRFPLDDRRRTGFLWPDFGNDSTGGLDITAPFYFNLAPNYDALYSPRLIEERGLSHGLELRYLSPLVGSWSVGGAYMDSDDRYENEVAEGQSTDRWLGVIRQDALWAERWRSRIDYSKASDRDYIRDLDTANLDSQRRTSLRQLAQLDYLGDSWSLNIQAQQFQSLADDIINDYKKLPQITAQYRNSLTPFAVEPVFVAQYSDFDDDDDRVTGQRLYGEAGITYPMIWPFAFAQPTVKYRYLDYELDNIGRLPRENPSAGSAVADLDMGLFFERPTSLFSGKVMTQTLEPRLYYLYSEFEDQTDQPDFDSAELTFTYSQLFRDTRFSGRDRLDDANQLAIGLTTRFIDDETGTSLLSASIGQIYYFRDREVRLRANSEPLDDTGSELAGELTFTPNDNLDLRTSLIYDPFSEKVNSGFFLGSYRNNNGGLFNLSYSFRRPSSTSIFQTQTEQVSTSMYWPLNNRWSIFAAVNYSLEADKSVEDMAGVEYDTCCWTVRLLHLRYLNNESDLLTDFTDPDLERENTTQFQIVLKGMGGYGDRITQIMEDLIRGFEERDD